MENIKKTRILRIPILLLLCIYFFSCNRKIEFYYIHPPDIYVAMPSVDDEGTQYASTLTFGDTIRRDIIIVKNFDIKNPEHVRQADCYVSEHVAKNYDDYFKYSSFTIVILEYCYFCLKSAGVGMDGFLKYGGPIADRHYVELQEYTLLEYHWKKGKFVKKTNVPEYRAYIKKISPKVIESEVDPEEEDDE